MASNNFLLELFSSHLVVLRIYDTSSVWKRMIHHLKSQRPSQRALCLRRLSAVEQDNHKMAHVTLFKHERRSNYSLQGMAKATENGTSAGKMVLLRSFGYWCIAFEQNCHLALAPEWLYHSINIRSLCILFLDVELNVSFYEVVDLYQMWRTKGSGVRTRRSPSTLGQMIFYCGALWGTNAWVYGTSYRPAQRECVLWSGRFLQSGAETRALISWWIAVW